MGTTLTGTTPQDTYDSLIKVTDNGPLSGTAKYLSDGLGNDSALALSTARVGIGTNSPSMPLTVQRSGSGDLQDWKNGTISAFLYQDSSITQFGNSTNNALSFATNGSEQIRITGAGNVGIGTSSPEAVASSNTLQVNGAEHSFVRTGTTAFGGYLATVPIVGVTAISNARNPITGTYNNTGVAASVISLFSESANSYITFSTATANNSNPSERVRVTSNGLTFNGDTAAANALDDYEEGTFTPTTASDPTGAFSAAIGEYTKIGNVVNFRIVVTISANFSDNFIGGLPFTIGGSASPTGVVGLYSVANSSSATLVARTDVGTSQIRTYSDNNVNNPIPPSTAMLTLRVFGTYRV